MEGTEIPLQWTEGTVRADWHDERGNLAGKLKHTRLHGPIFIICIPEIVGDVKIWKCVHDHQLTYTRAIHMVRICFL